jgi:ribosome-associated protein
MEAKDLLQTAAQIIFNKKGFNLLALEIGHFSNLADFILIAEGFVDRHLQAMAWALVDELKARGVRLLAKEESGQWLILDFGLLLVHLFLPKARESYQIERIFSGLQKIVPLNLDLTSEAQHV